MSSVDQVLHDVQAALKVPKSEWNDFGKYRYRNAEAILQSVKPLLPGGYHIVTDCRPVEMRGSIVVECTATLAGPEGRVSAMAYAVEPDGKKGMDAAQVSGSTISYARKYALGNLLAIDGTEDSDAAPRAAQPAPGGPGPGRWIERARELERECAALGMGPGVSEEFLRTRFGTTDLERLTREQLEQYGRHLRTIREGLEGTGGRR